MAVEMKVDALVDEASIIHVIVDYWEGCRKTTHSHLIVEVAIYQ